MQTHARITRPVWLLLVGVSLALIFSRRVGAQSTGAGSALSFPGPGAATNLVRLTNFAGFPSNAITVELWMRSTDTTNDGSLFSYAVAPSTGPNANEFLIFNYRNFQPFIRNQVFGGLNISANDGAWHHVALTWTNDGEARLYRDGEQVIALSNVASGLFLRDNGFVVLGQDQDSLGGGFSAAQAFVGDMDELRIWTRARTEDEIRATRHRVLNGAVPGLIANYHFNEPTNATVSFNDAAPTNHLELAGDVTRVRSTLPLAPSVQNSGISTLNQELAVITATLNPNSRPTHAWAEFGETMAYGTRTAGTQTTATNHDYRINFQMTGLAPNTAYQSRVVSSNDLGTTFGENIQFVTRSLNGTPGSALAFDGFNDYLEITNGPVLGTNFTQEAWIFPTPQDAGYHGIIGNQIVTDASRSPSLYLFDRTRIHAGFGTGSNWLSFISPPVLQSNAWNHVAVTYDGASFRLYVNGLQAWSHPVVGVPTNTPVRWLGRVDNFFPGLMDEVRLWNVTRTHAEILEAKGRRLNGSEPGLVGYYRFDEGSGLSTFSSTSNSHGARLVNGPQWVPSSVNPFMPGFAVKSPLFTPFEARLQALVEPHGTVQAWFEWGRGETTNRTAPIVVTGTSNVVPVTAEIAGLQPRTLYMFRLVVSNSFGVFASGTNYFYSAPLVTSLADSGPGSLREAVAQASSGATIFFATNGTIQLINEITIATGINIVGPGPNLLTIRGTNGENAFLTFVGPQTISGLTITGAKGVFGGAIVCYGQLTLSNVVITGNSAEILGGGAVLSINGRVAIRDSTLSGNVSSNLGGALFLFRGGDHEITGTTISDNVATGNDAGGLFLDSANVFITNSTFSGNVGLYSGAITVDAADTGTTAALWMHRCTVVSNQATLNHASLPGGVRVLTQYGGSQAVAHLEGSLFANPHNFAILDVHSSIVSHGHNLSSDAAGGDGSAAPGGFLDGIGDVRNTDPRVAPLANNGGLTLTHALLPDSPALGMGARMDIPGAVDQRGWPRIGVTDIGAYEFTPTYAGRFGTSNTWNVYLLVETPMGWADAQDIASGTRFGGVAGHLVSIHSQAENDFVYRINGAGQVWLGLTDNENYGGSEAGTNGTSGWVWTSGEPFTYDAWAPGQPNDVPPGEDAARMLNGDWWDGAIGRYGQNLLGLRYVIEFPTRLPAPPAHLTPAPPILPPPPFGRLSPPGHFSLMERRGNTDVFHARVAAEKFSRGEGTLVQGIAPTINHVDPDLYNPNVGVLSNRLAILSDTPGVDDDFVQALYRGRIRIPANQGGVWTFGVESDDGFALRLPGRQWIRVYGNGQIDPGDHATMTFPHPTGNSFTLGQVDLPAGDHELEFLAFELGGSASWQVYAARGAFTNREHTSTWQPVGGTNGLALVGHSGAGTALSFDGTNGAVTATLPMALQSNYTFSTWLFLRSGGALTDPRVAVLSSPTCGSSVELLIRSRTTNSTDPQYLELGRCNFFTGLDSERPVPLNRWIHVAVTVGADKRITYYIDGLPTASWNGSELNLELGPAIALGNNLLPARRFDGLIDAPQIWNVALSHRQIQERMFARLAGNEPGLVAHWRFNEGSGTQALNAVPGGLLRGSVTGATWVASFAAENVPVENLNDSGVGSLRDLVQSVAGATLLLPSSATVEVQSTIVVSQSVAVTTASGQRATVRLAPGAPPAGLFAMRNHNGAVNFSRLNFRDGRGTSGGAIFADGFTSVAVFNSQFSGNRTLESGGAIATEHGFLWLYACLFENNAALGDGQSVGAGGAISRKHHSLTGSRSVLHMQECSFLGNQALHGGAVYSFYNYAAPSDWTRSFSDVIEGTTIASNVATFGGGILLSGAAGASAPVAVARNTTLSGNTAGSGGALRADGILVALTNCTITANQALLDSAGVLAAVSGSYTGVVFTVNSVIADNRSLFPVEASDLAGHIISFGHNMFGETNGALVQVRRGGDVVGVDPMLGPLADNGGLTLTHVPLAGSPVIDRGDSLRAAGSLDQRWAARVRNGIVDIGAVEACVSAVVVTNLADNGPGTLRQRLLDVCDGGTIVFASNLLGRTIFLTNELVVGRSVNIIGLGAKGLAISGSNVCRVFNITNGTVLISDVTIRDGYTGENGLTAARMGGGVRNAATLTLERCYFTRNVADWSGGALGAVPASVGTTITTVRDCTFEQNFIERLGQGGAVANGLFAGSVSACRMTLLQCTISGNSTSGTTELDLWGGGVANSGTEMLIEQCTITANTAQHGGGIFGWRGLMRLRNSIVAGNISTNSPDVGRYSPGSPQMVSEGSNLIGDRTGSASAMFTNVLLGDVVGDAANPVLPLLSPLTDANGGSVPTHLPAFASPARDAGNDAFAVLYSHDQRGQSRRFGPRVDIGAVEVVQPGALMLVRGEAFSNGWFRFEFTSAPGLTFTVLTSTNVAAPVNEWTVLGAPNEVAPGVYRFPGLPTAPAAQRFYRLQWP